DPISATGTATFLSALVSMFILRIGAKIGITTFKEVLVELKWPILSIGMVLAFAFVTNYSGMSTTLALVLAGTGQDQGQGGGHARVVGDEGEGQDHADGQVRSRQLDQVFLESGNTNFRSVAQYEQRYQRREVDRRAGWGVRVEL
ncbi:L-lactate permease, partial [Pseudomonas aeruginosa]